MQFLYFVHTGFIALINYNNCVKFSLKTIAFLNCKLLTGCFEIRDNFSYILKNVTSIFSYPNFFLYNNGLLLEILQFTLGGLFCECKKYPAYVKKL